MEHLVDDLTGQIKEAAKANNANRVAELRRQRESASLTETVRTISSLQAKLVEKLDERAALIRKLDHLRQPVQAAATEFASALELLERCQLSLHELQAQQHFCDNGLHLLHDDIRELEERITELTATLEG